MGEHHIDSFGGVVCLEICACSEEMEVLNARVWGKSLIDGTLLIFTALDRATTAVSLVYVV